MRANAWASELLIVKELGLFTAWVVHSRKMSTSGFVMKEVFINKESVELYKILKFQGWAASGGEAKSVIADGLVQLNGQSETQKRKQIKPGDVICLNGESFLVKFQSAD